MPVSASIRLAGTVTRIITDLDAIAQRAAIRHFADEQARRSAAFSRSSGVRGPLPGAGSIRPPIIGVFATCFGNRLRRSAWPGQHHLRR